MIIQEVFSSKFFYNLFFSWSYNIRDVFIALLLYQFEYLYVIRTTEILGIAPDANPFNIVAGDSNVAI